MRLHVPGHIPGVPRATARQLLRKRGLWTFPALVLVVLSAVLSLSYLGGIINPAGNLHRLPLAVVDQDRAVHADGGQVHLGPRIAEGITSAPDPRGRVAWRTTNLRQAVAAMDDDKVYGALVIPARFSADTLALASSAPSHTATPHQPKLRLLTNPRSGSVATSLAQAIGDRAAQAVSQQVAAELKQQVHTGTGSAARKILLARPVTLVTTEHRPLGNHSGFGLTSFYLTLLLVLTAYVGAGLVSSTVDTALGYQSAERGRRWSSRLPLPITRTQTLLTKTAVSAGLATVTASTILLTCTLVLHMDVSHPAQLWAYAVCASIAVAVSTQALIALFGGLGSLVGMIFFVALAVPSSGGSFPLEAVPGPFRWLAEFEPMRQINDGIRALLYFDARADAGLDRGWSMIAVGGLLGLALGFAVARRRDRRGHQRLTPQQLAALHRAAAALTSPAATAGTTAEAPATGGTATEGTVPDVVPATAPPVRPAAVPVTGAGVYGRVQDPHGRPVPGTALTLVSVSGHQVGLATTRAGGTYALGAPGPGRYTLIATADGHRPHASAVALDDLPVFFDVVLPLSGTGRHAGAPAVPVGVTRV
ncbi:DUF3533 domain-containing protein [Streptomyces sp. NPDC093970]|uniref:DUF3533 domain-containing protein n=1 Tax=Streptomyces sp. NPDC093970 TaxID=3155076 RepID=UPI003447F5D2